MKQGENWRPSFTVSADLMACHCQDVIEDAPEKIQFTQSILRDDNVYALSKCCDGKSIRLSENIEVNAIRTQHVNGSNQTYRIKLCFDSGETRYEWGYTSDTCFFEEIGSFFQEMRVLIFNISEIYISDVEGRKAKHSHLGFDGSINLLEKARPRVAFASEFCCTNGDYRHEIVRALRQFSGVKIFPSDPGLIMDIGGNFD